MDKTNLFSIGNVAKMFNLSVGSLRHYENLGILQPEYIDENTGYRYYSTNQFECLNTIRYLRMLDMPLEKIGDFLNNRDINKMQEMLYRQKRYVVEKQKELRKIEKKINNRLSQIEDALSSQLDVVRIEKIASMKIAYLQRDTFNISNSDCFECAIRQIEENQESTAVFLGKVGVGITKDNLLKQKYIGYDMVFIVLENEDDYTGKTEILKEEKCVVLRFCGCHNNSEKYYEKMLAYIKENNLKISGSSREVTLIDYGLTNDVDKFVTEIQIPIGEN